MCHDIHRNSCERVDRVSSQYRTGSTAQHFSDLLTSPLDEKPRFGKTCFRYWQAGAGFDRKIFRRRPLGIRLPTSTRIPSNEDYVVDPWTGSGRRQDIICWSHPDNSTQICPATMAFPPVLWIESPSALAEPVAHIFGLFDSGTRRLAISWLTKRSTRIET